MQWDRARLLYVYVSCGLSSMVLAHSRRSPLMLCQHALRSLAEGQTGTAGQPDRQLAQGVVYHRRIKTGLSDATQFGKLPDSIQAEGLAMGCLPNKRTHALYCELHMLHHRPDVRPGPPYTCCQGVPACLWASCHRCVHALSAACWRSITRPDACHAHDARLPPVQPLPVPLWDSPHRTAHCALALACQLQAMMSLP